MSTLIPGGTVNTVGNNPLGSDAYRKTLDAITKIGFDKFGAELGKRLVPVLPKSRFTANGNSVETREYYGGGPIARVGEFRSAFIELNQYDGFRQIIGPREYAAQFTVTNLALEFAKSSRNWNAIGEGMSTLANGAIMNRTDITWSIINNATNRTLLTAPDGQPVASQTHLYKDFGTYSNLLPGNATYDTIRAMIVQIMRVEDHLGYPMQLLRPGDTIHVWCTPEDYNVVCEAIFSPGNPGNNYNVINTLETSDYKFMVHQTQWLRVVGQRRPVVFMLERSADNVEMTTELPGVFMVDWGLAKNHEEVIGNAQGGVILSTYDVIGWGCGDLRRLNFMGYIDQDGNQLSEAA